VSVIAGLPAADRAVIAQAAYETATLVRLRSAD
jgi:hypothetical protein